MKGFFIAALTRFLADVERFMTGDTNLGNDGCFRGQPIAREVSLPAFHLEGLASHVLTRVGTMSAGLWALVKGSLSWNTKASLFQLSFAKPSTTFFLS